MRFLSPIIFLFLLTSMVHSQTADEKRYLKKLDKLDQKGKIKLLDSLENSYLYENLDEGISFMNFLVRYVKEKNLPEEEIADLLYCRGSMYRKKSEYSNALNDFKVAEQIYRIKDQKKGLSSVFTAYSNLYQSVGDKIKSIKYIHKAIAINDQIEYNDGLGVSYNSLANIYLGLKNYDSALYYYKKSYLIYQKQDAAYQRSLLLDNISMVYYGKEIIDSAYVYSKLAREEAKAVNEVYLDLQLMLNATAIEEKLGHTELNMEIATKAKRIADSLQIQVYQWYTQANYASALFHNKKSSQAIKEYRKLISGLRGTEMYDLLKDVYMNYSEVFSDIHETDSAFHYYKLAVVLSDTIAKQAADEKVTELIARNQLERKENRLKHEQELRKTEQEAFRTEKKSLEKQKNMQWWIIVLSILAIIITIVLLIIINKRLRENRQLTGLLKDKNTEVLDKNKSLYESKQEIISSITYAKRIQYALLAHDELLKKNLPDFFVWFQPKDIVSGDFYWATEKVTETGKEFYLAVCDSTGHGVPGAFMSLLNISFLNEAINEKNIVQPNEILNHVRKRLVENMEGAKDGMDAILIRVSDNKIQYAAAHNRPLLIRNNELVELETNKMPVGMDFRMDSFTNYELIVKKGDLLIFSTDGFADQFGGPKNKKFKYSNFHKLLLEHQNKDLRALSEELENAFNEWKGMNEQVDDICILGVKI